MTEARAKNCAWHWPRQCCSPDVRAGSRRSIRTAHRQSAQAADHADRQRLLIIWALVMVVLVLARISWPRSRRAIIRSGRSHRAADAGRRGFRGRRDRRHHRLSSRSTSFFTTRALGWGHRGSYDQGARPAVVVGSSNIRCRSGRQFETANEIHIPVGRNVRFSSKAWT